MCGGVWRDVEGGRLEAAEESKGRGEAEEGSLAGGPRRGAKGREKKREQRPANAQTHREKQQLPTIFGLSLDVPRVQRVLHRSRERGEEEKANERWYVRRAPPPICARVGEGTRAGESVCVHGYVLHQHKSRARRKQERQHERRNRREGRLEGDNPRYCGIITETGKQQYQQTTRRTPPHRPRPLTTAKTAKRAIHATKGSSTWHTALPRHAEFRMRK